jgi:hypothetical protein
LIEPFDEEGQEEERRRGYRGKSPTPIRQPCVDSLPDLAQPQPLAVRALLRIPAKANADSGGNVNGIPGRRRTVLGA